MENLIESDPLHFLKKVQVQKKKKKNDKKEGAFFKCLWFYFCLFNELNEFLTI